MSKDKSINAGPNAVQKIDLSFEVLHTEQDPGLELMAIACICSSSSSCTCSSSSSTCAISTSAA